MDSNSQFSSNSQTISDFSRWDAFGRLANRGFITLKVYGVLGRLVRTLVNKVEQPGSYSVTFSASGLASGVYFYRLDAGTFTETKKLLLIR